MAKYEVRFSCGHKGTVYQIGRRADIERILARFESEGICQDCQKKQAEKERLTKKNSWGGARAGAGRKPDENRRACVSAFVTPETKESLQKEATQKQTTVSRLVGDLLEQRKTQGDGFGDA